MVLGWARVLVGEDNCAFCAMLASRGPVYKREIVVKSKDGRRYHRHCDQKMVAVITGTATARPCLSSRGSRGKASRNTSG